MSANNIQKSFSFRFMDTQPKILLELTNVTNNLLRSIEILTIFLKDEEAPDGGPSQVHIRFDGIKSMAPKETAVVSHRTWINGRPAEPERDQMARLKVLAGKICPYVLDISWENESGKAQFQRLPVGH